MSYSVTIQPSYISGTIQAPTSKSSMQRACAAALLVKGKSIIYNPGKSNDDIAALQIITQLGAIVSHQNNCIEIDSTSIDFNLIKNDNPLSFSCGESGLSMRMFTPIAALFNQQITITGEGSLAMRPMNFFDEILPQLGVNIVSNEGKLPLVIKGPLNPFNIEVDGSLSSQFLTGLLMVYSIAVTHKNDENKEYIITVNHLKSKPYINLTLNVMKHFKMLMPFNDEHEAFIFKANDSHGVHENKLIEYTVEGDWSGAAFLAVAGAIAGKVVLKGLDIHSTQADKNILQAIKDAGATIEINNENITICASQNCLVSFAFDATDCPDLFPPLVALASYCKGTSIIKGVSRLAHKESNRGLTLQQEFAKMGVEILLEDDFMKIKTSKNPIGATVQSHHDHRIAMACAIAALKANGFTTIEDAGAINKSYPNFYEDLKELGAIIGK